MDRDAVNFNPLRPCGRRHTVEGLVINCDGISTRSARGGGDKGDKVHMETMLLFQPAPPVGAETRFPRRIFSRLNFNPLRPWGRRRNTLTSSPG